MRMPEIIKSTQITKWVINEVQVNGKWIPARPEPRNCIMSFSQIFIAAWRVFIGKYDAFEWVDK